MKNKYLIYRVISPSGKSYFGKTNNLILRKKSHILKVKNGSKLPFHNAIRKYGGNMSWNIFRDNLTEQQAFELESVLIRQYNTFVPNGYNATMGGGGVK